MNSALWNLNGILAIFLITIFVYIGFSLNLQKNPIILSIVPSDKIYLTKYERPKTKDIKFIYESNDLFGTYSQKIPEAPLEFTIPNLPKPPAPIPVVRQHTQEIQFLEPLPIKITGIISHSIESESRVILVNTNTKEQDSYKVGDKILDAYIVRIFPKKIILIRSNGQQEILYRYDEDAQEEIKKYKQESWSDVVQQISPNGFVINAQSFINRVTSLAQLIEMLDATTAFSKGESIGCRIGKISEKSLGAALGFLSNDIITNINDIAPTTTTNRVNIYNKIISLKSEDKIVIRILRKRKFITNIYTVVGINKEENASITKPAEIPKNEEKKENEIKKIEPTDSKLTFLSKSTKPQVLELKKRDKKAMLQFGSQKSVLKI